MASAAAIYTIGHSNHEFPHFLSLLHAHGVTVVADVRSQPYSRLEHFRQDQLKHALRQQRLDYVLLGKELGARREEPECYENGQVNFQRVAQLPAFLEGIARVERGAAEHVIALMCAEREPLNCHRTVLVARRLAERGCEVQHILADGSLEPHAITVQRMIELVGRDPLFDAELSAEELRRRAYREYASQMAYRRPASDD